MNISDALLYLQSSLGVVVKCTCGEYNRVGLTANVTCDSCDKLLTRPLTSAPFFEVHVSALIVGTEACVYSPEGFTE